MAVELLAAQGNEQRARRCIAAVGADALKSAVKVGFARQAGAAQRDRQLCQ